ncbi:hypothetical protein QJQ45_029652 [Haematococcus lacustris]|nr:hypothetical protein QJQ45_029652 [Haematococcus lacustris]
MLVGLVVVDSSSPSQETLLGWRHSVLQVGSLDTRSHLQIVKQFLQWRSKAGALSCAGMATLDEQMKKVQEEFDDVKDKITRIEALPEGNPERQRLVELERAQNFLREKEILLLRGGCAGGVSCECRQHALMNICSTIWYQPFTLRMYEMRYLCVLTPIVVFVLMCLQPWRQLRGLQVSAIGASTNNPFQPSAPSKWMITILLGALFYLFPPLPAYKMAAASKDKRV